MAELEFCPYKGERIPKGFVYEAEYSEIVDFFNKSAKKCVKELVSKVFVMRFSNEVVGFVALSLKSVIRKNLSGKKSRGLFDRPALVIGQLIIDGKWQGKGFGKTTIKWAIAVARHVAKFVPCRLLFVEAIDEKAAQYYQGHGFSPIQDDPLTLVLDLYPFLQPN